MIITTFILKKGKNEKKINAKSLCGSALIQQINLTVPFYKTTTYF